MAKDSTDVTGGPVWTAFRDWMVRGSGQTRGDSDAISFLVTRLESLEARVRELEQEARERRTYELEQRERGL